LTKEDKVLLERLIIAQRAQENMVLVDDKKRVYCGTCGQPASKEDMKNTHWKEGPEAEGGCRNLGNLPKGETKELKLLTRS